MTYSYNRLWELFIDRYITKKQTRKAAGIITNILAKICVVLDCSLDDIVEIQMKN